MTQSSDRARPVWVFDGVVAAVITGLSIFALVMITPAEQALFTRGPEPLAYVLVLAQAVPIAFRRIRPGPALTIIVVAFVIDRYMDFPATTASVGLAFAFHALGSELPRNRSLRIGLPIIAVLAAFTVTGIFYVESVSIGTVIVLLIATLVPLLLGREVNEKRRYLSELEERARRLELEREQQAREAVAEERARIARELHDVVAHEMTVMTIQAAAAKRVVSSDPAQAAEALAAIEEAGHDALTEMRRLLGLLRPDEPAADMSPQPGLARLEALVAQMDEAGLAVTVETSGEPEPLATGIDLNVYRIIQESLTNSLRHGGPGNAATVRLSYQPDRIDVEIADKGRGAAASDTGGGHGLLGMKERVMLLDGEFTAGPRRGGGFVVKASIPKVAA